MTDLACALEETDVAFDTPLVLLHELPPRGAMVEHPLAEVRRASRGRVEVTVGEAEDVPVRVAVETTMVRLRGVAHAANVTLFPAYASSFGRSVTPLARHALHWSRAVSGSVLLALTSPRRASLRVDPEWRECTYLRLRPSSPFAPDVSPAPEQRRRLQLAPGRWSLFTSPDAPGGSFATVDLRPEDAVWLLQEADARWSRVLWVADETAVVGWVNPSQGHGLGIGSGEGTGVGRVRRRASPRAMTCSVELPLLVDDRGTLRDVGVVKAGASVVPGASSEGRTRVVVEDPDVAWADGVPMYVPAERFAACGRDL